METPPGSSGFVAALAKNVWTYVVLALSLAVLMLKISFIVERHLALQGNKAIFTSTQAVPAVLPVSHSAITSVDSPIARDSAHVWYNGHLVEGADPATFVLITDQNGPGGTYARDKNHAYIKIPQESFLLEVRGADPRTFTILKDPKGNFSEYGKDRSRIFFLDTVLGGADYATFVVTSPTTAKDKNHIY